MKTIIALSLFLLSFAPELGGEHYQVFLNNSMLLQEVIHNQKELPSLTIDETARGTFAVMYDHCGQGGTSRSLTLQSDKNQVLKKWEFTDAEKRMTLEVKEVVSMLKGQSKIRLVYASNELPKGRALAFLSLIKNAATSRVQ